MNVKDNFYSIHFIKKQMIFYEHKTYYKSRIRKIVSLCLRISQRHFSFCKTLNENKKFLQQTEDKFKTTNLFYKPPGLKIV